MKRQTFESSIDAFVEATNAYMSANLDSARLTKRHPKHEELGAFHDALEFPIPKLFTLLLSSYAWIQLETENISFFAHPAASPISKFVHKMLNKDPALFPPLVEQGFLPFATATHGTAYDPYCLDTNSMSRVDCPVVKFDHEAIFLESIGKPEPIAASFGQFLQIEQSGMEKSLTRHSAVPSNLKG